MLDILVATMNTWLGEKDERIARDSILAFIGFLLLYVGFFSPVLFSDFLLGPGDGVTYYIPAFYALKTLWSNLIFAGYPVAADPQMMTWYPVARLLYYFPSGWNIFVLSAYVLAATFTFAYVRTIVGSRLAGIVSALTYSMSGFMFSHLSHTTMIHGAAWLPLALLSFENYDTLKAEFGLSSGHLQYPVLAYRGTLRFLLHHFFNSVLLYLHRI